MSHKVFAAVLLAGSVGLIGLGPAHADVVSLGDDTDNSIKVPSSQSQVVNSGLESASAIQVSGLGNTVRVVVQASAGTVKLTSAADLTKPLGYPELLTGGSEIAFVGSEAAVNSALENLTYSAPASYVSATIKVSAALDSSTYIFNPDNGHYYRYVSSVASWGSGKSNAEADSFQGMSGYLATITSASEQSFLASKLVSGGPGRSWTGGALTSGAWTWMTGPEAGIVYWKAGVGGCTLGLSGTCTPVGDTPRYNNWVGSNPSGDGAYMEFMSGGYGFTWNDRGDANIASIREFSTANGSLNADVSVSRTITVTAKDAQSITFAAMPDRSVGGGAFTVSATASSALPVTFTSRTEDVCTVSASTVNLVALGTCTLRASQPGDAAYSAAPDVDRSFTVTSTPAQASGMSRVGTTASWSPIPDAAVYFVMYRVVGSGQQWGVYAAGGSTPQVVLNNTKKRTCSAANAGNGYSNCALPYGWSRGKTYEFAVSSRNAAGKSSLLPLQQLMTYTP